MIQIPNKYLGPLLGNGVTITDDHIRAIVERAKEMGLIADNTPDPWADKPAAPVDDCLSPEAVAAIKRGCEDSLAGRVTEADFSAHASNADEVDEDMLDEMIRLLRSERDTLKAEVERLRADNEYLSGYGADLSCIVKILNDNNAPHDGEEVASDAPKRIRLLAEQRDAAIARAEKAEAKLKLHAGDCMSLSNELRECESRLADQFDELKNMTSERDTAIARADALQGHLRDAVIEKSEVQGERDTAIADFKLMQAQRDEQALEAVSARAAHAEEIELLRRARECSEGIHFGSDLTNAIDARLAKYGKETSK